jgi:parallel beta-helix repeat protein
VEVKNCLLWKNSTGLYYEASYSLYAHDNVVVNNAYTGICFSTSMGCLVERNLLVGNNEVGVKHSKGTRGVYRIDTPETSADTTPSHWFPSGAAYEIWNAENIVRNNIFAYNAGVKDWIDVLEAPQSSTGMQALIAAQGEAAQLRHENNFFVSSSPLFAGTFAGQSKSFSTLAALWAVRPDVEVGSSSGPLAFEKRSALNFRVPADAEAVLMGCYPQGDVPGVTLGIQPAEEEPDTVSTAVGANNYSPLRIYPNPVADAITIENDGIANAAEHSEEVQIYNMAGTLVGAKDFSPSSNDKASDRAKDFSPLPSITVDLSHLPTGVYVVRVGNRVGKVVKK